MAFSDFPMPRDYPAYARHDQVAAYFNAYVDHFGFRDRITFDTKVTDVARGLSLGADGYVGAIATGASGMAISARAIRNAPRAPLHPFQKKPSADGRTKLTTTAIHCT